jgi:hypothetical protein
MSALLLGAPVVRPRWIRYSDYDQVPPVIEEITLDD